MMLPYLRLHVKPLHFGIELWDWNENFSVYPKIHIDGFGDWGCDATLSQLVSDLD